MEEKDLFKLQDDLTSVIAQQLVHSRTIAQQLVQTAAFASTTYGQTMGTKNLDAYHLFLRAREEYTAPLSQDKNRNAEDFLKEAIKIDPAYARAHALLARVFWTDGAAIGTN